MFKNLLSFVGGFFDVAGHSFDSLVKHELDLVSSVLRKEIDRAHDKLVASLTVVALAVISYFFIAFGAAKIIDVYSKLEGLGYLVIGVFTLLVAVIAYLATKQKN